ncbi:C2 calcium-dependent domain-containing protein 4A [Hypomesus transpacificus]|uniref:C2 calcium-dependent domain-containing protein 4A n=1 Tax=Hypomesus transpacificus TaxID=137520 RepID=UPI001F0881CE|nr:C2 calcium-dependent domain-containing protein 4A [Hypomesus transpacificus]
MWVVEKIRVSVEKTNLPPPSTEYSFRIGDIMFGDKTDKSKKITLWPNIITPDTIPEFCIPPKIPSLPDAKAGEHSRPAPIIRVSPCERGSPRRHVSARELLSPHIIQVESVDEGPYDNNCSDEETTNADPQSQAALSLPHMVKTQTCYGFCTLLESPHTRRKESLFHNDPGSCGVPLLLPRSRSNTCSRLSPSTSSCSSPSSSPSSLSLNTLTARLSPRGYTLNRQGTTDSDTTSSAESSPFSSPLLPRSLPKSSLFKTLSHERLLSRNIKKNIVSRNNSLSTDEGSSTDNSPNVMRRASEGLVEGLPRSFGLAPPKILPLDLVLHRERMMKESLVPIGKDGILRLSAEYCPDNQRLRVRLISAEGLYALCVEPKSINCSISLSLVPGKVQKQRSTVIRKSRNPIFNEDFFFDAIAEEDLSQRSLRFKVVNKMSTMKRDYVLGDCELPLTSIITL